MRRNSRLTWDRIKVYLKDLGITARLDVERVKEIFGLGEGLCPEPLRTIFISNYLESNGKEQFKDLWLFSDDYVVEVLEFSRRETPRLEMTIFTGNIMYVVLEAKDFDFSKKAQGGSKLRVKFGTLGLFSCDFAAFGQNCNTLSHIWLEANR